MAISAIGMNLRCEPCKIIAHGAIGAVYAPIGDELEHSGRFVLLQNHTDAMLWFSMNGIDDSFPLAAGDKVILDCSSNSSMGNPLLMSNGSNFFVKQLDVPTTGSVYVTIFYGE
jgi:hypothetical protein